LVAAWRLGVAIHEATIVPGRNALGDRFAGRVRHQHLFRGVNLATDGMTDRARIRAERNVLICLAGPAAQRRRRRSSWRSYHGLTDHEVAVGLAFHLYGHDDVANAYLRWLELRADHLMDDDWSLVTACAGGLLRRKTLKRSEIAEILTSGRMRPSA
jgi:hypothetical protein